MWGSPTLMFGIKSPYRSVFFCFFAIFQCQHSWFTCGSNTEPHQRMPNESNPPPRTLCTHYESFPPHWPYTKFLMMYISHHLGPQPNFSITAYSRHPGLGQIFPSQHVTLIHPLTWFFHDMTDVSPGSIGLSYRFPPATVHHESHIAIYKNYTFDFLRKFLLKNK